MITFGIPDDERMLAAIGKVAVRHGQLDYILRMTVKSIEGLSVKEAIDATERQGSTELRRRVRRLAKQKFGDGPVLVRLDGLLTRCQRATSRRNELLHGLWAQDVEGQMLLRTDGHDFHQIPEASQLETLADRMAEIASDLNTARLSGFLHEAINQHVSTASKAASIAPN